MVFNRKDKRKVLMSTWDASEFEGGKEANLCLKENNAKYSSDDSHKEV